MSKDNAIYTCNVGALLVFAVIGLTRSATSDEGVVAVVLVAAFTTTVVVSLAAVCYVVIRTTIKGFSGE